MEAGAGGIGDEVSNAEKEHITTTIVSVMMVALEDAMRVAGGYCRHAERNTVLVEDIRMALKVVGMSGFWETPNLKDRAARYFDELAAEVDDDEEEEEMQLEYDDDDVAFTASTCTCKLCVAMNAADVQWQAWVPSDSMGVALKKSLEQQFS